MSTPELDAQLRSPAALRATRWQPVLVLGSTTRKAWQIRDRAHAVELYGEINGGGLWAAIVRHNAAQPPLVVRL